MEKRLRIILEPHRPVCPDAEAGGLLHGVHVGSKEQKFPAVPFFFPLNHPADLLVAKPPHPWSRCGQG